MDAGPLGNLLSSLLPESCLSIGTSSAVESYYMYNLLHINVNTACVLFQRYVLIHKTLSTLV